MVQNDASLTALLHAGYRYASTLASNPHEAEDLVHESWVRITESYGNRSAGKATPDKALLFRVIRNMHIDHFRRLKRFPLDNLDDHTLPSDEESGSMISNAEDRQLQSALATLRVREREALFLSVIEGYTAQEIAELTQSSRGTILSLIHRARQKLNQRLTAAHTNVIRLVTPQGKN